MVVTSWATLSKALNFFETFRIFRIVEAAVHESNGYISPEIIGPLHMSIPVINFYPLLRQQKELEPKGREM